MKVVFLDRDGVINKAAKPKEYILSWDEFEFNPGVLTGIKKLNDHGYDIIIITNQSCINRGLICQKDVDAIHEKMVKEIESHGGKITDIYYCPHRPDEKCSCRKPEPGMLDAAVLNYTIEPKVCWMVGDNNKDVEAGERIGCKTFLVPQDSNFEDVADFILLNDKHQ